MAAKLKPQWAYYYDYRKINPVFAISMAVLFVSILLMVRDDYSRPWKGHQRAFYDLEARKAAEAATREAWVRDLSVLKLDEEIWRANDRIRLEEARKAGLAKDLKAANDALARTDPDRAALQEKKARHAISTEDLRRLAVLEEQTAPSRQTLAGILAEERDADAKIAGARERLNAARGEKERREGAVAAFDQKLAELGARVERLTQESLAIRRKKEEAVEGPAREGLQATLEGILRQIDAAAAEMEEARADREEERRIAEDGLPRYREKAQEERGRLAAGLKALGEELKKLEAEAYVRTQNFQFRKADYEALRFEVEEFQRRHEDSKHAVARAGKESELKELEGEVAELENRRKEAEVRKDDKEKEIAAAARTLTRADAASARAQREVDDLQARYKEVGRTWVNTTLGLPIVDAVHPPVKIQQDQHPLTDDYTFASVQKLDRCVTCHMGIDKAAYAGSPNPFKAHPFSEAPPGERALFVGANSHHPREKFGCTVCHEGNAKSVDFTMSVHTPRLSNRAQKETWEHEHGWFHYHLWDRPMLPMEHVAASCLKCHDEGRYVIPAPERSAAIGLLNKGRLLFEQYGCFACHKTPGYEQDKGLAWKVGPSLRHLRAKTNEGWVKAWLLDPPRFRKHTRMPRFFGLSNNADPEQNKAEAAGIAAYLFAHAEDPAHKMPAPEITDEAKAVRNGKRLVRILGCAACHTLDEKPDPERQGRDEFGPDLSRVGLKTTRTWLFHWVLHPELLNKDTRMPNLRLTEEEARDVAAYLSTLKAKIKEPDGKETEWADAAWTAKEESIDAILLDYLLNDPANTHTKEGAQEVLKDWAAAGKNRKLVELGGRLIRRYGCFACHDIPGMEKETPIGTPFAEEGSKFLDQFDFGFQHHIAHDKFSWVKEKLKDPRQFDKGKAEHKRYDELLKMPYFGFGEKPDGEGERQTEALATFVLGHTREKIPAEYVFRPQGRAKDVYEGEVLLRKFNCRACHFIEGQGGDIQKDIRAAYAARAPEVAGLPEHFPPGLTEEGRKVRYSWLFDFLKNPHPVRRFVKTRMPTFRLSDEEASKLVAYFAAKAKESFPFRDEAFETDAERARAGAALASRQAHDCFNCHAKGSVPGGGWHRKKSDGTVAEDNSAPNLLDAHERLNPLWLTDWLRDPTSTVLEMSLPRSSDVYPHAKPQVKFTSTMPQLMPDARDPRLEQFKKEFPSNPDLMRDVAPVLGDREKAILALRDYLAWIGRNGGVEPPAPPPAPTPASDSAPSPHSH